MKKNFEKRQSRRFRIPTLAKYRVVPDSANYRAANIRNISVSGMALLTDGPVKQGARLDLCFLDPNGTTLHVKGTALHSVKIAKHPHAFKVGVRFEEVPADVLATLRRVEGFFLEVDKDNKR